MLGIDVTVTTLRIMVDGVEYVIVLVPKISVWSWAKTVIFHFIMMRAAVRNALGTAILYNGHRYPVLVFCHVFSLQRVKEV